MTSIARLNSTPIKGVVRNLVDMRSFVAGDKRSLNHILKEKYIIAAALVQGCFQEPGVKFFQLLTTTTFGGPSCSQILLFILKRKAI